MNRTYRLIWNQLRHAWMAAHEHAGAKCAAAVAGIVVATSVLAAPPAPNTLPTGGQVVAGQAAISQAGSRMTVNQASDKAILNWQSFSIGANAAVNFAQPSASSVALNRVLGADASAIYGQLTANGQVFLVNSSGVYFAPGASVNVGGLVASTMNIRNEDFLAGNYRFTRDGAKGSVVNAGELNASYVALLAPEARNEGVVIARSVALAAGDAVKLSLTGQKLVDVRVEKATIDTLVENKHLIQAGEGTVILSAQSARELRGRVVNTGMVEANGITSDGGVIRLSASSDIQLGGSLSANAGTRGKGGDIVAIADLSNPASLTTVSGSLSARGGAAGGDGGFIETSGSHLKVADSMRIDTSAPNGRSGQWLLDPTDFTVALSGGDITGAALGTALATNDVTIQTGTGTNTATDKFGASGTDGDIFVNDAVTWAANTKLTMKSNRHVEVNAPITATGGAASGVVLEFGQGSNDGNGIGGTNAEVFIRAPINLTAGSTFKAKMGSTGTTETFTVITSEADLAAMPTSDNTVRRALGANITSALATWVPIGNGATTVFDGMFDGLGHTVTGITRANTANTEYVGLFGSIGNNGVVQNIGVVNPSLAGLAQVGALAGENNGIIRNSYAKGGTVTGSDIDGTTADSTVLGIGGLVGRMNAGNISRSYAAVNVTATSGDQSAGSGNGGGIGGFVGTVMGGTINNSYATGSVEGLRDVGGFAGFAIGSISQSYSTGMIVNPGAATNTGGFIGIDGPNWNDGFTPQLLTDTYWNTVTSGQATSAQAGANSSTGLDNTTGKQQASYTGFDFTNTAVCPGGGCWVIREGVSHPLLRAFLPPLAIKADDKSKTFDNAIFAGAYTASFSSGTNAADTRLDGTAVSFGGTSQAATAAGNYTIVPSGPALASQTDQHGFLSVAFLNGTLAINPAVVTVVTAALVGATTKVYDGNTNVTGLTNANFQLTGFVGADGATVTKTTGTYDNANVGTNKTVTVTLNNNAVTGDFTAVGATDFNNYTLPTTAVGNIGAITAKALTVTGQTATNRAYDGTTAVALAGGTLNGVVGADVVNLVTGTGTMADKNAGNGKAVTVTGTAVNGAASGNYSVSDPLGLTVDIAKKDVTLAVPTVSKTYDGGLTYTPVAADLTALSNQLGVAGDTITGITLAYAVATGASAGTGNKTVQGSAPAISDGNAGNNYNVVAITSNATSSITKKPLTVTGQTAMDKDFDGGTVATLTGGTLNAADIVGADVVTLVSGTGAFADALPGANKPVAVTGTSLAGASAGNYSVSDPTGLTATITGEAADTDTAVAITLQQTPIVVPRSDPTARSAFAETVRNTLAESPNVAVDTVALQTVASDATSPADREDNARKQDAQGTAKGADSYAGRAKSQLAGYKDIRAHETLTVRLGKTGDRLEDAAQNISAGEGGDRGRGAERGEAADSAKREGASELRPTISGLRRPNVGRKLGGASQGRTGDLGGGVAVTSRRSFTPR